MYYIGSSEERQRQNDSIKTRKDIHRKGGIGSWYEDDQSRVFYPASRKEWDEWHDQWENHQGNSNQKSLASVEVYPKALSM